MTEQVVLVNINDEILGLEEKIKAHKEGLLHRAFSVFIFRKKEKEQEKGTGIEKKQEKEKGKEKKIEQENEIELLIQQRHIEKYHCGGLWTNTCCSHPRLNEEVHVAGKRRLKEELSLDIPLISVGTFIYRSTFQNGLTEHELDHVLIGEFKSDMKIVLDPNEVAHCAWQSYTFLENDLQKRPEIYTPWFKPALKLAMEGIWHNF